MIYAIITTDKRYPSGFAIHTNSGSKAENAMYTLGYGVKSFYFSKKKLAWLAKKFVLYNQVCILDKHGHKVQVSY